MLVSLFLAAAQSPQWLTYEGDAELSPGNGRRIVFVAGDEEYRSEEALPFLARSMNRLGFECIVLFSQNQETGLIDPDESTYIPGLHLIADAELLVLQLRFREFLDDDMKHIVDYVEAGKPLVGLRTSTHAFNYGKNKESKYAHWTWTSKEWPGGFGKQILGETWVSHHGHHGHEATRGIPNPSASEHVVLKGVGSCFGLTDVYTVGKLPDDATVLLHGEVVAGMDVEDIAVDGKKNDPMLPVAWLRERVVSEDVTQRIFATTMGAAVDWLDEDLHRLFFQASMWCLGDEDKIATTTFDGSAVGVFEPTMYGFGSGRLGYKPEDYRNGSPWLAESATD